MIVRTRTLPVAHGQWGQALDPVAVQETQLEVYRQLRDAGISSTGRVRFLWEVREATSPTSTRSTIRRRYRTDTAIPVGTVEVSCVGSWTGAP
jgi:hypothetical protein